MSPAGQQSNDRKRRLLSLQAIRNASLVLSESIREFHADRVSRKAAALAFYTLFSLAPLLIISIAIAGSFFGEAAARGEIVAQIGGLVGEQGALAIEAMLRSAQFGGSNIWALSLGIATLLLGATTAFAELKEGLDQIWGTSPEHLSGLFYTVWKRVLSFGVILSVGFLLLVSLIFSAAVSALQHVLRMDAETSALLQVLNFLLSFILVTAMFAVIYKLLPAVKISWRDVFVGSLATALLFNCGKYFIGLYLGHSAVTSAYGAAGSVILLLMWVYYSSLIFLFGAEFTKVYSRHFGSMAKKATSISGFSSA